MNISTVLIVVVFIGRLISAHYKYMMSDCKYIKEFSSVCVNHFFESAENVVLKCWSFYLKGSSMWLKLVVCFFHNAQP